MSTLLLKIAPPAKIYVGEIDIAAIDNGLMLDGTLVEGFMPPWPVQPDVLLDAVNREFIGLTFDATQSYFKLAKDIFEKSDSLVARLHVPNAASGFGHYLEGDSNIPHLEIRWASADRCETMLAQLAENVWFYDRSTRLNDERWKNPFAIGLADFGDLLNGFGLKQPTRYLVSPLDVSVSVGGKR